MKVKVRIGDRVTYNDGRRYYQTDLKGTRCRVEGILMYKMGECYSVSWYSPKQYRGGFSLISEKCLNVLLKRGDSRWQNDIHTQEINTVA